MEKPVFRDIVSRLALWCIAILLFWLLSVILTYKNPDVSMPAILGEFILEVLGISHPTFRSDSHLSFMLLAVVISAICHTWPWLFRTRLAVVYALASFLPPLLAIMVWVSVPMDESTSFSFLLLPLHWVALIIVYFIRRSQWIPNVWAAPVLSAGAVIIMQLGYMLIEFEDWEVSLVILILLSFVTPLVSLGWLVALGIRSLRAAKGKVAFST